MGIGLGLGVVAAAAWASIARSNHREWEKIKRVRGGVGLPRQVVATTAS